eukprot:5270177-Prymnesium_polylepis.1
MSNVCALALVVTATSPASGGGYYLARAQPDRPPGSSPRVRLGLRARCVDMCVLLDAHTQVQTNAAMNNYHGRVSR